MQFDPGHLAALAAILRRGTLEAAAEDLSVTPSAVSQRLRALEDRVGTVLVLRGAPCTGTEAGLRLARLAEDIGLLERQARRDLSLKDGPSPTRLRVAVNADSLATWFIDAMAAVPDMLFDLVLDDQDHSADWLRRGEVSAAVTAVGKPVTGCDAVPLGSLGYVAIASPTFRDRWFADGVTAAAMARAPTLTFNAKDALQRSWTAAYLGRALSAPTHFIPSAHGFADAARANMGWGMIPETMARHDLATGRLVELIADTRLDVPLTWQLNRVMAPALQPVTRAVRRTAATVLRDG